MLYLFNRKKHSAMQDIQDIRLHIHIENTEPMELMNLTSSLVSLNNQYVSYVRRHSSQNISSSSKLYIKEIREGSTILELVEVATVLVLPFLENVNTILGFTEYCKQALQYFTGKSKDRPGNITKYDCQDFSNLVNPIISDHGGVINIGTVYNGEITIVLTTDNTEANAIQNAARREIELLTKTEQTDVHKKVLMTWDQASSSINNNSKNKGVIDSIFPNKALKILYLAEDEDAIKKRMLYGDENPLKCVYEVDVMVEVSQNRPIAYRILKLHQIFEA